MERPSPTTASPNILYVDMRATDLTVTEVLEAAFPEVGNTAIGFKTFAVQCTLGLTFATTDDCQRFLGKSIGDTGLYFHAAPSEPAKLQKFTLSDVPLLDATTITTELRAAFKPWGT